MTMLDPTGSLRESFRQMGLSESAATLAAGDAFGPVELREPEARADKPSAAAFARRHGRPTGDLRESPAGDAAGPIIELRESTPLERAFLALGLSESAARIAARGRER
jgi:hypothetical protein